MLHSLSPQLRQTRDGTPRIRSLPDFHCSTSYSDLEEAFRSHVVSALPSPFLLDLLDLSDPPLDQLEDPLVDPLVDLLDHDRDKSVLLAEAGVARESRSC